jgi:N-acetylneuraminic acid mutarotase
MSGPHAGHTATRLPSGQVMVVGGSDGTRVLATTERYDPASNTWSAAAPLAVARWLHTTTLLTSGQLVVAGGSDGAAALASVERYDPDTQTWAAAR